MSAVFEKLQELEAERDSFTVDGLMMNEEFKSSLIQAWDIAKGRHEKEKLAALRNVAVNTALGFSLPEYQREVFMDLVRRYSSLQLQALKIFDDPNKVENKRSNNAGISEVQDDGSKLSTDFAEPLRKYLKIDDETIRHLQDELLSDRLVVNPSGIRTLPSPELTERGKLFLNFISDP